MLRGAEIHTEDGAYEAHGTGERVREEERAAEQRQRRAEDGTALGAAPIAICGGSVLGSVLFHAPIATREGFYTVDTAPF